MTAIDGPKIGQTNIGRVFADHWRVFLVEGIVLVILGSAAILVPVFASIGIAVLLGWLFIMGGTVSLGASVMGRHAPGFWWSLLSALVALVVGFALIGWPVGGAVSLTVVLIAFLVVDGLLMCLFALEHRRKLSRSWGWILANGGLDLFLAGLIVWALPGSAVWALGLIVGIDLIFAGWSLIAMALAAGHV